MFSRFCRCKAYKNDDLGELVDQERGCVFMSRNTEDVAFGSRRVREGGYLTEKESENPDIIFGYDNAYWWKGRHFSREGIKLSKVDLMNVYFVEGSKWGSYARGYYKKVNRERPNEEELKNPHFMKGYR